MEAQACLPCPGSWPHPPAPAPSSPQRQLAFDADAAGGCTERGAAASSPRVPAPSWATAWGCWAVTPVLPRAPAPSSRQPREARAFGQTPPAWAAVEAFLESDESQAALGEETEGQTRQDRHRCPAAPLTPLPAPGLHAPGGAPGGRPWGPSRADANPGRPGPCACRAEPGACRFCRACCWLRRTLKAASRLPSIPEGES